mmetsp:Transcript_46583/g.69323  ORF Transcript_46583/g.69323 Transcript_46583/m.69323 type:complete len:92 (+) Transcript_46583:350-625(+)
MIQGWKDENGAEPVLHGTGCEMPSVRDHLRLTSPNHSSNEHAVRRRATFSRTSCPMGTSAQARSSKRRFSQVDSFDDSIGNQINPCSHKQY